MSLFTKVKCKYYFQKKVDNKALSKSGRQTQLLRSTETYSRTFCQASLTVEAAVVLPLFIGFMVFLLFYFRIMQTELAVEQAMMYTARVEAACVSKSSDTVHPAKVQLHFLKSAKEEKVPFEYIDGEKRNVKQIIESKIDNKARYSLDRCIEEMFKDKPYGLYKFGYIEDLEKITPQSLYKYYKELINTSKIDIFCSGAIDESKTIECVKNNEKIQKLIDRKPNYIVNNEQNEKVERNPQDDIIGRSLESH